MLKSGSGTGKVQARRVGTLPKVVDGAAGAIARWVDRVFSR